MSTDRPKVVFSERLGHLTEIEQSLEADLGAIVSRAPLWTVEEIALHARDADAVIVGAVEPLNHDGLVALASCRLISRRGVGLDNIDLEAATQLGIAVAFVPDASVSEVSDHALALILAMERRIVKLDSIVKGGEWTKAGSLMNDARDGMRRLSELTLGVVGYGRIGRQLARKARPLFDRILAYDALPVAPDDVVAFVDFESLLSSSDVLSLHAPLTDETRHLFDIDTLSKMKRGSVLVNTSRGGLIDTAALAVALDNGRLGGVALDVTEDEPVDPTNPLLSRENVILTGHSAAFSEGSKQEARRSSVAAIAKGLGGARPPHIANPEVFDAPNCRLVIDAETSRGEE